MAPKSNKINGMPLRTAAPPAEDLMGYYIFTTYHLLLKEIRNEAGDTEIVTLKSSSPPVVPTFVSQNYPEGSPLTVTFQLVNPQTGEIDQYQGQASKMAR